MNRIAIFLVLYNDKAHIPRLIESLRKQTFKGFDVFAVECGETKDSSELLKRMLPNAKIFPYIENMGYGKGNNYLLRKALLANYEYAVVLNTDIILDSNFLKEILLPLEKDEKYSFASPIVFRGIPELGQTEIQNYKEIPIFKWGRIKEDRAFTINWKNTTQTIPVRLVNGCAFIFRLSTFKKELLFTEDNFMYGEELDLAYRMYLRKWKGILVSKAKVWHNHNWSHDNKKQHRMMQYYMTRNRILFYKRYKRYDWLIINIIREMLIVPLKLKWGLKNNDKKLLILYYIGFLHGLVNISGRKYMNF